MTCGERPETLGPKIGCLGDGELTAAAGEEGGASTRPDHTSPGTGSPPVIERQSLADTDGSRLVVLCACVIALLLFLYIVVQYIRQRRRALPSPRQGPEQQQELELSPKIVTMYEALDDDANDSAASPSNRPVVVVSVDSFTGNQGQAVAVAYPVQSDLGSSSSENL